MVQGNFSVTGVGAGTINANFSDRECVKSIFKSANVFITSFWLKKKTRLIRREVFLPAWRGHGKVKSGFCLAAYRGVSLKDSYITWPRSNCLSSPLLIFPRCCCRPMFECIHINNVHIDRCGGNAFIHTHTRNKKGNAGALSVKSCYFNLV